MSLSLDHNGLSLRDLQSLTGALTDAARLSTLSLSGNFNFHNSGIGTELARILLLPHLDSLFLRGADSARLAEQLIPLVDALWANTTIKHLDISGNRIGRAGLAALAMSLANNNTILSLSIDGSEPPDVTPVVDLFTAVANSTSLLDVPYPLEDIFGCCATLGDDARARAHDLLAHAQAAAEARLVKNRANAGIFSGLSLIGDPVLDEVIDDIALEMVERLQNVPVAEHLAINEVVGLPLPFEQETVLRSARAGVVDEEGGYVAQAAMQKVVESAEGGESDPAALRTLMFNSMLIRRPDAEERLRAKGDFLMRIEAPADMQESLMPERDS
jgi:hypothetical protein